jgi:hypothetical protein
LNLGVSLTSEKRKSNLFIFAVREYYFYLTPAFYVTVCLDVELIVMHLFNLVVLVSSFEDD